MGLFGHEVVENQALGCTIWNGRKRARTSNALEKKRERVKKWDG